MFGEAGIEQIILTLGYVGIFGLMIANGIFSFPSSQILYIVSGYFIFIGSLDLLLVSVIGAIGNTIGNTALFYLTRKRGLAYITKFTLLPVLEIKKVQAAFARRGALFVFVGKLLPAIKVFIPIVAGIGNMRTIVFVPIILISSFLWSLIFIGIGYFFGKQAELFGVYALVLVAIALSVVYFFYRYINSPSILKELGHKK